jgi:hypothetical protein
MCIDDCGSIEITQKMKSKVYFYKEYDSKCELYVGNLSTIDGLMLFKGNEEIQLKTFGATNYKTFGWTTENDLPQFKIINDLILFFQQEPDVGLIEFDFKNGDRFSSHDDGECKLVLNSKEKIFNIIRNISPLIYQDKVLSSLMQNQEKYITIDKKGDIKIFFSFEDYLKSNIT